MSRRRKTPPSNPRIAVAYGRVSREDLTLDQQWDSIERWAALQGVTVAARFEDTDVSGDTPVDQRDGLLQALGALRGHGAGLLVAARRDRLARDVGEAAALERLAQESGARVVTADGLDSSDTPEGKLVRTIIDAMAAYELALIRARTKAALRSKKARGERTGSVPFGMRAVSGKLEADTTEQAALARMRELAATGCTQAEIVSVLTAEGFKARGARWHVTTIARALRAAS